MATSSDGRWRKVALTGLICFATLTAAPSPAGAATAAPATPADDVVLRPITLPVRGSFSYSDDFGDPRSGGRTHQGNDLMVPKLRPLLAATDGRVSQIRVDDGSGISGNMLTIRDDDGWRYVYIHINNDTPGTDDGANPLEFAFGPGIDGGAKVKAGQVVAYAGDSGNAEGTGPHLHFEIHEPDGTAINPYPSLRIAQGFRVGNYCAFDLNPKRRPNAASAPGYWALGADGGVFAFGSALFHGSTGDRKLNRPSVAMAATPGGSGYWFAASDGGIFAFGDAAFFGSTGSTTLNQPIAGMASTASGKGYWLVARDGGIFTFGDAAYLGSLPGTGLCELPTAARILPSATGKGYWVAGADGSVRAFGDASDHGSPRALGVTIRSAILDLVTVPRFPAKDGVPKVSGP